jgi:hypothetical protein
VPDVHDFLPHEDVFQQPSWLLLCCCLPSEEETTTIIIMSSVTDLVERAKQERQNRIDRIRKSGRWSDAGLRNLKRAHDMAYRHLANYVCQDVKKRIGCHLQDLIQKKVVVYTLPFPRSFPTHFLNVPTHFILSGDVERHPKTPYLKHFAAGIDRPLLDTLNEELHARGIRVENITNPARGDGIVFVVTLTYVPSSH